MQKKEYPETGNLPGSKTIEFFVLFIDSHLKINIAAIFTFIRLAIVFVQL